MITKTLNHIEEQTGLELKTCDHFPGVQEHHGEKYFNVILRQRTSESKDFDTLQKFANKYNSIKVEPNGLKRVAIYPTNNNQMSKTNHYICKVKDSKDNYEEVTSIWTDQRTNKQAEMFFKKHYLIKDYIGDLRYQIVFTMQNSTIIQDPS